MYLPPCTFVHTFGRTYGAHTVLASHACAHKDVDSLLYPPLHVLGSRSARNSSSVILRNKPWDLVMPTLTCWEYPTGLDLNCPRVRNVLSRLFNLASVMSPSWMPPGTDSTR